jgi:hypothetical protein
VGETRAQPLGHRQPGDVAPVEGDRSGGARPDTEE